MVEGALYWRLKDERTGKWTYRKVNVTEEKLDKIKTTLDINELFYPEEQ